jgi:hypothetical protein
MNSANPHTAAPESTAPLSDDDINTCVRVLRAIEYDRSHLNRLTQERRRELLTFAGLVAKPERHELAKMAKAFRRSKREATKAHDRQVLASAGLRVQRRAAVYTPLSRARLLRVQEAVHSDASILRFHVHGVRRLQLCQT